MKTKSLIIILLALVTGFSSISAQGFKKPSEGKAAVYFVRITMYGAPTSFEFFHNDKYIGVFNYKNYMVYECDPGNQLLWASSENKEFVTTDLQAGGVYVVLIDVIMGGFKARVGMTPIGPSDERFARAQELVEEKPPVVTPQKKIDDMNKKLGEKFIPEILGRYENEWKAEKNFKHISADMAVPENLLR
jgi:hypothetical protein